jgi:predicted AlkP superfamily pyrophosphatase or phosphodiesterase
MSEKWVAPFALLVTILAGNTLLAQEIGAGADLAPPRPKLILQLTVDQLRGDLPLRYRDRFGPGGFRYLLEHGAWYAAASHPHSHTETVVGHTTLATGAYPSRHGMIGNTWFDRATGMKQYCVEDDRYKLVGTDEPGASPTRILTTTFSDELAVNTASRSRIFAVSLKDRGAIPLAGHTGKAFWFSVENNFVSSTYYFQSYPLWVTRFNGEHHADRWAGQTYTPLHDPATYLYKDAPPFASPLMEKWGYMRAFPHYFAATTAHDPPFLYHNELIASPFGDQVLAEFAETLIGEEKLGTHADPDYLAISFSSTDMTQHLFSVSSLESEDTILRLDRVLAHLFSIVDGKVGLANTLIVLAGDHGAPEVPEYLRSIDIDTGRLEPSMIQEVAAKALKQRFGSEKLILAYDHPYFYLDHRAIAAAKLSEAEVERTVAEAVLTLDGIAFAVPCTDLRRGGEEMDEEMIAKIRRNQHPKRSGDVYVVQQAQWQVARKSSHDPTIINHGTPWAYDGFVPVVFAGAKVPAGMLFRPIFTVDVAATLAAYLGTDKPSGLAGKPLTEVLNGR